MGSCFDITDMHRPAMKGSRPVPTGALDKRQGRVLAHVPTDDSLHVSQVFCFRGCLLEADLRLSDSLSLQRSDIEPGQIPRRRVVRVPGRHPLERKVLEPM